MRGKSKPLYLQSDQWQMTMGTAGHCTVSVSKSIGRFDDTLFYLISFILLIRYWFKTQCMGIWMSWIDILNVRYLALWQLRTFALKLFVNSCERDSDRPRHPLLPFSLLPFPPLSSLSLSAATLTLTGTPPRPLAPEYSWYQWGSTWEGDRR